MTQLSHYMYAYDDGNGPFETTMCEKCMGQHTVTKKSPIPQDSALSHVRDDGLFSETQFI